MNFQDTIKIKKEHLVILKVYKDGSTDRPLSFDEWKRIFGANQKIKISKE